MSRMFDRSLPWLIAMAFIGVLLYALIRPCRCDAQCFNGRCRIVRQPQSGLPFSEPKKTEKPKPRTPVGERPKEGTEPDAKFGVDTDKLTGSDTYTLHTNTGCHHLTKKAAQEIIGAALQDDSNKLRVTVIGSDQACRLALADLSKVPDLQTWAIIRGYQPGHWSLEPGFVQNGSPTIYCQAPNGKVLHRQDDYNGGAPDLVDALRKAKQTYDSRKDPDLRKMQANDQPTNQIANCCLAMAAGAGLAYVLRPKKG